MDCRGDISTYASSGQRIKVTAVYADGTEQCIIDIDDWDFGWQQSYNFLPDEWITIAPGDSVRLDCVYDNSAEISLSLIKQGLSRKM